VAVRLGSARGSLFRPLNLSPTAPQESALRLWPGGVERGRHRAMANSVTRGALSPEAVSESSTEQWRKVSSVLGRKFLATRRFPEDESRWRMGLNAEEAYCPGEHCHEVTSV